MTCKGPPARPSFPRRPTAPSSACRRALLELVEPEDAGSDDSAVLMARRMFSSEAPTRRAEATSPRRGGGAELPDEPTAFARSDFPQPGTR